jgi:hypothetical protein
VPFHKIGRVDESGTDYPWNFPDVWATERAAGTDRILIAPRNSQVALLSSLVDVVPEPMWLLYVLLASRRNHIPGRYQSPAPESRETVKNFLLEFRDFFEQDGRHNFWIGSAASPAMLIWDRHNRIFGYGPIDEFRQVAIDNGLRQTDPAEIRPPSPHAHHYHAEFDDQENLVLGRWAWQHTPLHDQDIE